jgi:hypothetical protein
MNAKVEQILRKSAYDFAIMCGASEEEAQAEADNKIKSVNKLIEEEKKHSGHLVVTIGAGPAGSYGVRKLTEAGHEVVILNRDIKPGGLVEYGIYFNKHKLKEGVRKQFRQILVDPKIRYIGHVKVGRNADLTLDEVKEIFGVDLGKKYRGYTANGESTEKVDTALNDAIHAAIDQPPDRRTMPLEQTVDGGRIAVPRPVEQRERGRRLCRNRRLSPFTSPRTSGPISSPNTSPLASTSGR